jgi:hypothetical protein
MAKKKRKTRQYESIVTTEPQTTIVTTEPQTTEPQTAEGSMAAGCMSPSLTFAY